MSYTAKIVLVGLVSFIVGAVAGGGYVMNEVDDLRSQLATATQEKQTAQQNADRLLKLSDVAATKYSIELGRVVQASAAASAAQPPAGQPDGAPPTYDSTQIFDSARAILAARDNFRGSLDGLRLALNSEFDALSTELGNPTPNAETVKQVMDNLRQKWPEKQKSIEAATRRLLTDLGLLPVVATSPAPAQPSGASSTVVTPPPAPAPVAPAPAVTTPPIPPVTPPK